MKIEYKFVTGAVEVEVSNEWGTLLVDMDRQEYNNDHKETRRHISLDACQYEGAENLKQREWVQVTATVKKEYWKDYEGEGPILHAVSVIKTKAPKNEVISFS